MRWERAPDEVASLYDTWRPPLRAAMRREVGDPDEADEIVQETFLKACQHWPTVSRCERPEAWLFRVAFNMVISRSRRRRAGERMLSKLSGQRAPSSSPVDDIATTASVDELLAGLPPSLAEVLRLRFVEDVPVDRVARLLEQPAGTVKTRTRRGVLVLRERLEKEQQ